MASVAQTILIVEDELAIVELISFALKAAGWEFDAVSTAADAWDYLQHKRPQLILRDWMLPDQ